MRGEFVARPALRISKDQKHAAAPVFLQRDHAALKVRQAKERRRLAGLESASRGAGENHPSVKPGGASLASHAGLDPDGGGHALDDVSKPDLLSCKKSGEVHPVRLVRFAGKAAVVRLAVAGIGTADPTTGGLRQREDAVCAIAMGEATRPSSSSR